MSDARKAKRLADRVRESTLLQALYQRFEMWMYRRGMVAFVVEPGAAPAPGPAAPAAPAAAPAAEPPAAPAAPAPSPSPSAAPAPAATPAPSAAPAPAATPAPSPAPAPAAPEAYADFKLPEGIAVDEVKMGEFKSLAKELNLTQDAAQKLVDLNARMELARAEQVTTTLQAWDQAARADKEIGGDKYDENMAIAAKARDAFATPEFVQFLAESKLGNHPEMLRAFYRIGQKLSEDSFVPGRAGTSSQQSVAQRMYPNMNP